MKNKLFEINIPKEGIEILSILGQNEYEAFVVGGCVRDSIMGNEPKDWDITTSSPPEKTVEIFEGRGFRVIETGLKHGTVTVMSGGEPYEITTYRVEGEYINNRSPEWVEFTTSLQEDLKRRDFTINAMAYNPALGIKDFFDGVGDIEKRIIKCVGDAHERFNEDALRMLRAVRFSSRLSFDIEESTLESIKINAALLKNISSERIREELNKILSSDGAVEGIKRLISTGLMEFIIPEILECVGFDQKTKYHELDVFDHIMKVLENTPNSLELRLAALFHDIGKPMCFTQDEKGGHFYGHADISAEIAENVMKRLKYDNKTIENVRMLVKEHMVQTSGIKKKTIRKIVGRIGEENIFKLFYIMKADRLGSNPEYAYLDDISAMKEKTLQIINAKEPLRVTDLKINGKDLMELGFKPGPHFGAILNDLLDICLEDPAKNTREQLIDIVVKKRV